MTTAQVIAAWGGSKAGTPGPTAAQGAAAAVPAPAPQAKTAQPAAAHAKVETAPLALMSARTNARPSAPTAPAPAAPAQAPAAPADGHERAKRRARVILSDLSLYHRDELVKAAAASDPKLALGTLWRDAVISYNEGAAPELRGVTNYLEEELDRYLVQLRSA